MLDWAHHRGVLKLGLTVRENYRSFFLADIIAFLRLFFPSLLMERGFEHPNIASKVLSEWEKHERGNERLK